MQQRGLTVLAFWDYFGRPLVAVAQLVEPQIVVLVVAGSSPVGHPNFLFLADWILRNLGGKDFPAAKSFLFSFKIFVRSCQPQASGLPFPRFQILATGGCVDLPCWRLAAV